MPSPIPEGYRLLQEDERQGIPPRGTMYYCMDDWMLSTNRLAAKPALREYSRLLTYIVPIENDLPDEVSGEQSKTPDNPATTGGMRMFNTSLNNELAKAKDRNMSAAQTALRLKVGRTVVENATGLLIDAAPMSAKGLLRKNEHVTKFVVANLLATAAGLSDNFALKQFADAGIVHTINGVAELLDTDNLIDSITAGLSKADLGTFLGKETKEND